MKNLAAAYYHFHTLRKKQVITLPGLNSGKMAKNREKDLISRLQMNKSLLLLFVLLVACTERLTSEEQTYKEFCIEHKGAWMKMTELKDGKPVGPACYGCMPDEKNHICTQQEYEEFVK